MIRVLLKLMAVQQRAVKVKFLCTPSTALQGKQDVHDRGSLSPGVLCNDDDVMYDALQEGPQGCPCLLGYIA